MNVPNSKKQIITLTRSGRFLFSLASSAILLCSAKAFADSCPNNNEATTSGQEALLDAYQPKAYDPTDGTTLRRLRIAPSPTGSFPTVVLIHGGEFREQDDHGTHDQSYAAYDLAQAGYLVFSIEYRLAPDGLIPGQHQHDTTPAGISSGRPPQQSNDVKQEILAAYYDAQCNKKIFLLGGSSGGTHALWCALDATPLPLPATGWPLPAGKIKAVAGLSGVYDLSLRIPTPPANFIHDVDNYTNTYAENAGAYNYQYTVSPISLVANAATILPTRLYATDGDSVPPAQATNMKAALLARAPTADVVEYTITNSAYHAFQYWHTINNQTGNCVSSEVTAFFNMYK